MPLVDALALGPVVWNSVLARAETSSPFMSWEWHRAWAESVPAADVAGSEVLMLRGGDGVVHALLPVGRRRIPFHRVPVSALTWAVGDLGCPDHLDVAATATADVAPLVPALAELPWQVLVLSNLATNAPQTRRLCDAIAARGFPFRRRPLSPCPYLDLSGDWETYLATLSPAHRQTLRRKERHLQRNHVVELRDYDGARLDEGWSRLVALHELRWDGAGAFRAPETRRLHRRFAADLAARRQLWLTTLDLDGEPAAAWYGFAWCNTVYFYQSGRDPRWDRESVGLVLMGAMIKRAIERGYRRFDFLRGADAYKRRWTHAQRMTEEITIFRPGWEGHWLRVLDSAAELRARFRILPGGGAAPEGASTHA